MAAMRLLAVVVLACSARPLEALVVAAPPPNHTSGHSDPGGAAKLLDDAKLVDGHSVYLGPALMECKPCWTHNKTHPRLFIEEEPMGVGTRLHGFMNSMAVAAKFGMNFGGVVTRGWYNSSHGVDVLAAVTGFLGLQRPQELFTEGPPAYTAVFDGLDDMKAQLANGTSLQNGDTALLKPGPAIFLANLVPKSEGGEYYNDKFREALRWSGAPIQERPLFKRRRRPIVAMHVRRGDMSINDPNCRKCGARATSDEWNLWALAQVKHLLPDADLHVFSSLEGHHTSEEFQAYRDIARATVHLNDTEVLDPWAHFARADVVILGRSSFSWAPALVNPNCVIYQSSYLAHLPDWINTTTGRWYDNSTWKVDTEKLKSCIARVAPTARALR